MIDAVTVSDSDSRTVHPVLLRGSARWEIPAGQTAATDAVPLSVAAGDELLISCFVSGSTDVATFLHSAQRTGEVAPGDQLGRRLLADAERFPSLYSPRSWSTRRRTAQ